MLQHIGDDDRVSVAGKLFHSLEVGDHDVIETLAQRRKVSDFIFKADRAREVIAHCFAQFAAGRTEIDERSAARRVAANQLDEDAMTAAFKILEGVNIRHAGARWYRSRVVSACRWFRCSSASPRSRGLSACGASVRTRCSGGTRPPIR